jgi:hypothetical protein
MATAAVPDLLTTLQEHFQLVPNHDRALDGRVVDTRFDPDTRQLRDVTDHELVTALVGPAYGGRFFQTWYFTVDGIDFQFNQAFERWGFHGLRYRTTCRDCGEARCWRPIHKPPARQRCQECRYARSITPICDDLDLRCSTAYVKHGCRCDDCRAWNAANQRRRRAGTNSDSSTKTLLENVRTDSSLPVVVPEELSELVPALVTEQESARWVWLPRRLREVVVRYDEQVTLTEDANDA